MIPADEICACGHLVKHYIAVTLDGAGWDPGVRVECDVVERDCPHQNGTVIEHCPNCDAQVGMWGMGVAGTMECSCWETV